MEITGVLIPTTRLHIITARRIMAGMPAAAITEVLMAGTAAGTRVGVGIIDAPHFEAGFIA